MPKEIRAHERKILNILFKKKGRKIGLALSKGIICYLKSQNDNEKVKEN